MQPVGQGAWELCTSQTADLLRNGSAPSRRLADQVSADEAVALCALASGGGVVALRRWAPMPAVRELVVQAAPALMAEALSLGWMLAHDVCGERRVALMRAPDDRDGQAQLMDLLGHGHPRQVGGAWVVLIHAPARASAPLGRHVRDWLAGQLLTHPAVTHWRQLNGHLPVPGNGAPRNPVAVALAEARTLGPQEPPAGDRPTRHVPAPQTASGHAAGAPPSSAGRAGEPVPMTRAGLDALIAERERLQGAGREEVAERLRTAREMGPMADDGEWEDALREQQALEAEIAHVEDMIARAVVADIPRDGGIGVGAIVRVCDESGAEQTYVLVGPTEANPKERRISIASPLGCALCGRHEGEDAVLSLAQGQRTMHITSVRWGVPG